MSQSSRHGSKPGLSLAGEHAKGCTDHPLTHDCRSSLLCLIRYPETTHKRPEFGHRERSCSLSASLLFAGIEEFQTGAADCDLGAGAFRDTDRRSEHTVFQGWLAPEEVDALRLAQCIKLGLRRLCLTFPMGSGNSGHLGVVLCRSVVVEQPEGTVQCAADGDPQKKLHQPMPIVRWPRCSP